MGDSTDWTGRAPYIFLGVGLLMLLGAGYIAGGDQLECARHDATVDCEVVRARVFGSVTVERVTAADVVDSYVKASTTSRNSETPGGAPQTITDSNDDLVVKTRAGREVALLGGESSAAVASEIRNLLGNPAGGPVTFYDSYKIIAGALAAFGLVFVAFATFAIRKG